MKEFAEAFSSAAGEMKRHIDYPLMRSIFEDLSEAIDRATAGNEARAAVLAALTANGSGGAAGAYRFSPPQLDALSRSLADEASVDLPVTKRAVRNWLEMFSRGGDEKAAIRGLAGLHGYTLIAGIHAVRWGISLDELTTSRDHFTLANRLIDEYCVDHSLGLPQDLGPLGRLWTNGWGLRDGSVSMYAERLKMRFEIYRKIVGRGHMKGDTRRRRRG